MKWISQWVCWPCRDICATVRVCVHWSHIWMRFFFLLFYHFDLLLFASLTRIFWRTLITFWLFAELLLLLRRSVIFHCQVQIVCKHIHVRRIHCARIHAAASRIAISSHPSVSFLFFRCRCCCIHSGMSLAYNIYSNENFFVGETYGQHIAHTMKTSLISRERIVNILSDYHLLTHDNAWMQMQWNIRTCGDVSTLCDTSKEQQTIHTLIVSCLSLD